MLDSLLLVASTGLVPESNAWLSAAFAHPMLRTINPLMTLDEPTTLALAVVGLGTVGAFVALQRLRKGAPEPGFGDQSLYEQSIGSTKESRSRGAA